MWLLYRRVEKVYQPFAELDFFFEFFSETELVGEEFAAFCVVVTDEGLVEEGVVVF